MSALVTVRRADPHFRRYLEGSFSKTERALPVQSLNLDSDQEVVTFKIVPLKDLGRPNSFKVWMGALRLPTLLSVFGLLLWSFASLPPEIREEDIGWVLVLALLALVLAVRLRNDQQDYLTGYDRVRPERGNLALKKGWLTTRQFGTLSHFLFFVASALGTLLLLVRPELWKVLVPTIALGLWVFVRGDRPLSERPMSQLILFLLSGPLLAIGADLALAGIFRWESVFYGALWGWGLLFSQHVRDLENLVVEGQAGPATVVGHLGFDRSVRVIYLWWLALIVGLTVLQGIYLFRLVSLVLIMSLLLVSWPFLKELRKLASPAGSAVRKLRQRADYLYLGFCFIWILDCFWWLEW